MIKKHIISEKAPVLSMLLASGLAMLVTGIVSTPFSGILNDLVLSIASIAVLLIFHWWFSPEFKGDFKVRIPVGELCIILIPFVAKCVLTIVSEAVDNSLMFKPSIEAVTMGIVAGCAEETWFRGLAVPIGMGYLDKKNRIPLTVAVTSVFFGVLHIGNIFAGAGVAKGVIQSIATIFAGFLFIAVYLRSGSIVVPIIMHGFYDWLCFVTDSSLEGGVMVGNEIGFGLILALLLDVVVGLVGLYLIRPAMWGRIDQVWSQIWDRQPQKLASPAPSAQPRHGKHSR
ncbi:MAG: CPBP family intramembrane metalloprotease [Atopobiaceae bacterium]|nr:CPBP family intramembrane metalloprotease [Atopobiaceae bacterium]